VYQQTQSSKFYTELWADTSYKEMNWQMTNNENWSVMIQEIKRTLIKVKTGRAPSRDELNLNYMNMLERYSISRVEIF
jgi:hypothetical protein